MWPLQKRMPLQIALPEMAPGNVCSATPSYLKWTALPWMEPGGSEREDVPPGERRQVETCQTMRNTLVRWLLFLHFTHVFEHVVVQTRWWNTRYTTVTWDPSRRNTPELFLSFFPFRKIRFCWLITQNWIPLHQPSLRSFVYFLNFLPY